MNRSKIFKSVRENFQKILRVCPVLSSIIIKIIKSVQKIYGYCDFETDEGEKIFYMETFILNLF